MPRPNPADHDTAPVSNTRRERSYEFNDWSRLPGGEAEVPIGSRLIRKGTVDAATPDGRIVWLAQDGIRGSILIDPAEGYRIWISPAQLKIRRP